MKATDRRETAFGAAYHLVDIVREYGPDTVAEFWRALSPDDQLAVAVVLACQLDPWRITIRDLRAGVDKVAAPRTRVVR